MRVSRCWSKCLFCVISATNLNMFLNVVLCSVDQSGGLFFSVFFSNGRRAAAVCANFGIYRVRLCMDSISFLVFGGDSFSMASVFLIKGFVPSLLMLNPNHSTCLSAMIHLSNDIKRFSSSSFFRTDCNFCLCRSKDPFVTINISSK